MLKKRNLFFLVFLLFIFSSCDIVTVEEVFDSDSVEKESLAEKVYVDFIDVGQADSILITSSYGNMLIDGGENKTEDNLVEYIESKGIEKLDYVVATHPHSDHIGGLDKVIDTFDIGDVLMPKAVHTTTTYERLLKSIKNKNIKPVIAKSGEKINLGDVEFTVLSPVKDKYDNLNNYSVALKMTYNNISFLFAGDAEKEVEKDILSEGFDISCDVYKVSHHGSSTSSSEEFIKAMSPNVAVISLGKNNDYGHPHREVVSVLNKYDIETLRTDEMGTITISTDGTDIFMDDKYEVSSQGEDSRYIDDNGNGLIKGNINSKGDKIYHIPGGAYYEQTKAEEYFKTEEEAVENGYRKASR